MNEVRFIVRMFYDEIKQFYYLRGRRGSTCTTYKDAYKFSSLEEADSYAEKYFDAHVITDVLAIIGDELWQRK